MKTINHISNNIFNELVKEYKDKYKILSISDETHSFYYKNDISDEGHKDIHFERGENIHESFAWPGEKISFGEYRLSELTWEKLCAGQTFTLNFNKNNGCCYYLSFGLDFQYSPYEKRRVLNKYDWEEIRTSMITKYGNDVVFKYDSWGFEPIDNEFSKKLEEHNKAMADYMSNECSLGHYVD